MPENHPLKAPKTAFISKPGDATQLEVVSGDHDRDELATIGKVEVLKRRFGFMSMLGFSCTLMGTWAGVLTYFSQSLANGGSAGTVYGFLFCWIGVACVISCLCEMASMAPTSGGQYHFVAMLAPLSCQKSLSYIAGWATVASWQAAVAGVLLPDATMLQGLVVMNHSSYVPQRWHGTLLCYAFLFVALFVNTYLSKYLAKLEGIILILYIIGFFGIIISLSTLATHVTAKDVFTTWNNEGDWSSMGLAWFVSLSTFAGAFAGADGATHMAEEIHNASIIVPRSMFTSIILNGIFGFSALIALLFSLTDVEAALQSPTGYPFMYIFQSAAGVRGATVMAVCIICMDTFGTWAILATASRQMWAFSRDNGLPGSKFLSRVEPRTALPLYSIGLSMVINLLLPLINIASSTAFNAVISLLVSSFYLSFILPCSLLLWRRLTGSIGLPRDDSENPHLKNTPGSRALTWGPWRMPPLLGVFVNALACVFAVIIYIFSYWPQLSTVTPVTMNYSILVSGAVMLASIVYYLARGRRIYVGPIVEIPTVS